MSVRPEASLYINGTSHKDSNIGGWGCITECDGKTVKLGGGDLNTTENRMQLEAILQGIKSLRGPHIITIYSTSKYVCDSVNNAWLKAWAASGWTKKDGSPVKNDDLWKALLKLMEKHSITFIWVKDIHTSKNATLSLQVATYWANQYEKKHKKEIEPNKTTLQIFDFINVLEKTLRTQHIEKYGNPKPCGKFPYCNYCNMEKYPENNCAFAAATMYVETKE